MAMAGAKRVVVHLARSRLAHFCVLGGALFWLLPREGDARRIELTDERVRIIVDHATRNAGASLSMDEKRVLLEQFVEEELLVREARRLGLDDDTVIRTRTAERMRQALRERAATPVDEARVREAYERERAHLRKPASFSLDHVFVSKERADGLLFAEHLRDELSRGASFDALGDPGPTSNHVDAIGADAVARVFGDDAARVVAQLSVGVWSQPVAGAHGWSLLRVASREEARPPSFEEARPALQKRIEEDEREERVRRAVKDLAKAHPVVLSPGVQQWLGTDTLPIAESR